MFKEIGQFASLMKQAQGLQGKIAESKERIANLKCVGEAGGGMVSVAVSGSFKVLDCKIDAALVQSGDKEMLEELVVAAANQAFEKLIEKQTEEMNSVTGGLNLSGLQDALGSMGFGGR